MAYDEHLADRVRRLLTRRPDIEERAMFGGLAFMARGHMCCGLVKDKLMVRVSPDAYDQLLREAGARPMDFTGKPLRGFLYVTGAGISTTTGLRTWIKRALDFAESRPARTSGGAGAQSTRRPRKAQPAKARRRGDESRKRRPRLRG